ncbi:PAS domain S-box-containing protein [Rubrivivax gelatinosus]|uniref:sensor histidine kinase n=3 Tax=Rubrivivax gelatinosus TaxID=28068 RepID=UPI0018C9BB1F|nr:ATP-binding protein [Rubrivivax gelatinosus]MBG6080643.1 PAS domain S-box-containing protein [Rubrivivax gelatinosus]
MRWLRQASWLPGTIRGRLQLLVVACVVPGWLLALATAFTHYQRAHDAMVREAAASATRLVRALESEIDKHAVALQMLATSPYLESGDLRRFYDQALLARDQTDALTIVLFDAEENQLLNLLVPYGGRLPARRPLDMFPPPADDGRAQVSDLFLGAVTGVRRVSVRVPVQRDGQRRYWLVMVLSVETLADFLRRQGLPPQWISSVVDRQGITAARTHNAERFVGTPLVAELRQRVMTQDSSSVFVTSRDGIEVLASHARSRRYQWSVTIGAPRAALTVELRQSVAVFTAVAAALLAAGLALAALLGRSIAGPILALTGPARQIGAGRRVQIPRPDMLEARELADALASTQGLLDEREQARDRAEAALRRSEADLRLAIEASRMGTWDLDLNTGELHHSLQHDRCFGHDTPIADWSLEALRAVLHPDDRERVFAASEAAARHGQPLSHEFRVLWPDGSEHWVASHSLVLRDEFGRPQRVIGLVADITERKQGEALRLRSVELEAQNREIQAASRRKQEFLATVSHELRTPLNGVIGFANLLLQGLVPPGSPRHRQYLEHIARGGQHLLQVVNDLLDLSRIEAGRLEFAAAAVDLPALVDEALALVRTQSEAKRIELHTELKPLPDLWLDPLRLKQVLLNFVSNAVKFTPEGGRIDVRARALDAGRWRLEVQDTGVGIDEQDQLRLFGRYEQAAGAGERDKGTGLGLDVTRQLVELQGGRIGVHSAPGQGSVFWAELPMRSETARA